MLRLQKYDLQIRPEPGNNTPAPGYNIPVELFNHRPLPIHLTLNEVADDCVHFIAERTVPKAMTQEEVERETRVDEMLQRVVKSNRNGCRDDLCSFPEMPSNHNVQSQLST